MHLEGRSTSLSDSEIFLMEQFNLMPVGNHHLSLVPQCNIFISLSPLQQQLL